MSRDNPVTNDLGAFGWRERRMAAELLTALCDQGMPDGFEDDEVTVNMNTNSGYVFLSNSDYEVAMMNGDKLERWYSCPECGHEGFAEDMEHDGGAECRRYLLDIGVVKRDEDDDADEAENDENGRAALAEMDKATE